VDAALSRSAATTARSELVAHAAQTAMPAKESGR
jgi:hypothetical protein